MIQPERIRLLNRKKSRKGSYVLYWMQASQRAQYNHALEHAIATANDLNVPVLVYFGLTERFPEANERHYRFMLEGLRELQDSLERRGVTMLVVRESPELGATRLAKAACLAVCDRGYLGIQRRWRAYVAEHVECPLIQVESDVVVPVEEASTKEEYSAATFRPRVSAKLARYLLPLEEREPRIGSLGLDVESLDLADTAAVLKGLDVDTGVRGVEAFRGGSSEARRRLDEFLNSNLDSYPGGRNDPNAGCVSNLSPYLHFGQISPLYVALRVREASGPAADAFLEELVVRRELSANFVFYNRDYDSFEGLPRWAQQTLLKHAGDPREYEYSLEAIENARTHDVYWNAAQQEMRVTGKMHGYMRMYWGKKILEWSRTPASALKTALYLNNKYELDGRDPNGFAGVAWCFGKHDRPWGERPVFGSVRYMNDRGLRRKFDADEYARRMAV